MLTEVDVDAGAVTVTVLVTVAEVVGVAQGVATARRAREEATKAELKVRENILAEGSINCWKSCLN